MNGRFAWMVVMVLVLGVLMSGCGNQTKGSQQQEAVTLKIGTMPSIDAFPLVVAKQNGYFTNENLTVELIVFQSPVERDAALQSGEIDGTVTDIVSAALVRAGGTAVKIATITSGVTPEEGPFAIMAAPQSGIQTLSDLKGKSIGISTNTVIEYVTAGLLEEQGLAASDVDMTMVAKIPLRMEMVLNGQLDAGTFPEPMITFLESKGAIRVADDTHTDLSQAILVLTEDAIRKKGEALPRFFKAYTEAIHAINAQPENYRSLFVEEVRVPAEVKDIIAVPSFSKPQQPTENQVQAVLDWLQGKGLLQKTINYADFIQLGFYE